MLDERCYQYVEPPRRWLIPNGDNRSPVESEFFCQRVFTKPSLRRWRAFFKRILSPSRLRTGCRWFEPFVASQKMPSNRQGVESRAGALV